MIVLREVFSMLHTLALCWAHHCVNVLACVSDVMRGDHVEE